MKKITSFISFLLLVALITTLTACQQSNNTSKSDNPSVQVSIDNKNIQRLNNINTTLSKEVAELEHSFKDKNGLWNYVFYVGSIHNVPLQKFAGLERFYANSLENRTLEVETIVTKADTIKNTVNTISTCAIEKNIEHKWEANAKMEYTKNFLSGKVIGSQFKANMELGYSGAWSKNETCSTEYSSSYEQTAETIVTEAKKETIIFNKETESGFYGNTRLGSIKVFAFVCYDPTTYEFYVEYFGDIVADYWAFVYLTEDEYNLAMVETNYSQHISFSLPELKEPGTEKVDQNNPYIIFYDANGGEVIGDDGNSILQTVYNYGYITNEPKVKNKAGYDLSGWTYDYPNFKFGDTMPAAYIQATAQWKPTSVHYDSGEKYNRIDAEAEYLLDTIDISPLSPFMQTNSTFTFTIKVYIIEINEGYQELYLSNSSDVKAPYLAGVEPKTFAHGGSGIDKTGGWETFTFTLNAHDCGNSMYISYGASGTGEDDWTRARTTVDVTVNYQN